MATPQKKETTKVKDVSADNPKGTLDRLTTLAKQVVKAGKSIALLALG